MTTLIKRIDNRNESPFCQELWLMLEEKSLIERSIIERYDQCILEWYDFYNRIHSKTTVIKDFLIKHPDISSLLEKTPSPYPH